MQPDVGAALATVSADELAALLHCRRLLVEQKDDRSMALASLLDKLRAAVTDATWRAAELRLGDAARVSTGIQTTGPKKSCRGVT